MNWTEQKMDDRSRKRSETGECRMSEHSKVSQVSHDHLNLPRVEPEEEERSRDTTELWCNISSVYNLRPKNS